MVSSSSSSSTPPLTIDGFTYDVFISFRGEDTREKFSRSLAKALKEKGIRTFFDENDLHKGDRITPTLMESIKQSRMALVVLAPNYATSSFCLDELSHILDSIRGRGRFVWPIFYGVNPSNVRKIKGTYGKAMDDKASSGYDMDMVEKWKEALRQVADLSGTHFMNWNQNAYEFLEAIVKEVSKLVKPLTLHVADYQVGLEPQMKEVISRLNLGSNDEICILGIHGNGGIGKTTLAVAVYNSIVSQFQGSCYLQNVREESKKHGLTYLQNIILSKIVGEEVSKVTSVREGIETIKQRLENKKVLLLLDDVDKGCQLEALAGRPEWFHPGSRVIITTRDTSLLKHKITYEVAGLNPEDAFELLREKACITGEVSQSYRDILNRALTYSSGLPLALEVIGSQLIDLTVKQCESALDRYERTPHPDIQAILEVSFNALTRDEKPIFLDIACAFKGHELLDVERILHAHHGESKSDHIRVLEKKSLIKISESGHVTLHDLIEDMGKEIVKQESPDDPRGRSRLWSSEDIVEVLNDNTGINKNKIIYLDSWIVLQCNGEAFKKMENLKTLIVRCDQISEYPIHLPNSLRVLQWGIFYPSDSTEDLPFDCCPKKLVICEINDDQFASIVFKSLFNKEFENMGVLDIKRCSIRCIGNISGLSNLEKISFQDFENLTTIDESMGLLDKLKILHVCNCEKLTSFPHLVLPSLEEFVLDYCGELESIPSNGSLANLKILKVKYCNKVKSFPSLKLPLLEKLVLVSCTRLESIPPMYGVLGKLKRLKVRDCFKLQSIPPLKLPSLEELIIISCSSLLSIQFVGDGLLDKLKILNVKEFSELTCIPPLKNPSLEKPRHSDLASLESIPLLGDGSPLKLPSLVELYISSCDTLESISSINECAPLKIMEITGCKELKSIPPLKLPSLEELSLSNCYALESIPPLMCPLLKRLRIYDCISLESIEPIDGSMDKLQVLEISKCSKLKSIPPLKLPSLQNLNLRDCESLESIVPCLDGSMDKLEYFNVSDCTKLTSIPPLDLPLLNRLELSFCGHLESFPKTLGVIKDIKELEIWKTPIKELPSSFQNFTGLQTLTLSYCGKVKLPQNIIVMSELNTLSIKYGGWIFPKENESEERGSQMQSSSKLEFLNLLDCNISDESLAIGLKWFANVEELNLSSCNFTTLPECIKDCYNLRAMYLDGCYNLREIKRIPPSLKILFLRDCLKLEEINGTIPQSLKTLHASECISLSISCKRELLNQAQHEAGNTNFFLPQAEIPEWFDQRFTGRESISFWFRSKFPSISLCVVSLGTWYDRYNELEVIINGDGICYWDNQIQATSSDEYHLHLFHLKMENFLYDPNIEIEENKWNHVEIHFGEIDSDSEIDFVEYRVTASGIHVLNKEEDDVRFTNPYIESC